MGGDPGEGLVEVGRITRPHGIKGEVMVDPSTNRPERFETGAVHTSDRGTLTVVRARRHRGRWIVAYEEVPDRNVAEELRGIVLRGEAIEVPADGEISLQELVGREVVDVDGRPHGRVAAIEVNPAHDLLVLDTGALVPSVFVADADSDPVVVDVPEGLFDEEFIAANRAGVERRKAARKRTDRPVRRRRRT